MPIVPLPKLLVAVFGIPEERANILKRRHGAHVLRLLAMDRAWLGEDPPRPIPADPESWGYRNIEMLTAAFLKKLGMVRSHAKGAADLLEKARADMPGGETRRIYSHWAQAHRHVARKPGKLIEAMENLRAEVKNIPHRERAANIREASQWLHETGRMEAFLMRARQRGRGGGGGRGKKRRK